MFFHLTKKDREHQHPEEENKEQEGTSKRKIRPLSLKAQREKFVFTLQLHDLAVVEGRNARMICGVTGGHGFNIIWKKNGRKLRFKEDVTKIMDFSRETTGCIGIECVTEADSGEYTCEITDKVTKETLTTSCNLIVVPRLRATKEHAKKIPPTFVRKLQCKFY